MYDHWININIQNNYMIIIRIQISIEQKSQIGIVLKTSEIRYDLVKILIKE